MRNYVIINGVDSLTINGLAINELPPISKPPMRTLQEEIDGRDGDIITNLGYGSYDKIMTIGLYNGYDIDEIIAFFNGEGTIIFSNEPDKYYNYKIIEQIDYESLIKFRTATVTFHCQPFKYPVEEEPIEVDYDYIEEEGEDLTLEPTDGSPLSLTLKGNTSQYSTTGKNLLDINSLDNRSNPIQINGSTITFTTTGSWARVQKVITFKANTNYTIMGWVKGTSGFNAGFLVAGTSYEKYKMSSDGVRKFMYLNFDTNTATQLTAQLYANWSSSTGETTNVFEKVMIVEGTYTAEQDYEEYTGSTPTALTPAPNPSYPQPINVVTGDNEVNVVGKNLFDKDNPNILHTWFLQNTTVLPTISGSDTIVYIACQPNTTYTCSKISEPTTVKNTCVVGTTSVVPNFGVAINQAIGWQGATATQRTITTTNEDKYLMFFCHTTGGNVSLNDMLDSVQIEVNNEATTYEPYQSQTYPIYLGVENLLKYPYRDTTKTENGITFTDIGDGTIKVNGTASANTYFYLTTNNDDTYKKYNGKKLTISGCPSGGGNNTYQIGFHNDNFSIGTADNGNGGTFTGGDVRYNQAYIRINSGVTCDNLIFKPQLELGTKKNSYTPYGTTPIELCKIGDYKDYFYKDNGSWYIHKEIGKAVLDGSESGWTAYNQSSGLYAYYKKLEDANTNYTNAYNIYNYFTWASGTGSLKSGEASIGGALTAKNGNFLFCVGDTTNKLADFKTWLSTHNTIVYYVLATPTNTIITDTTLISQLDNIQGAMSYKGQTNIMQVPYDKPFIIKARTMEGGSDEAIINNVGNTYAKPTIDIEGNGIINVYLNGNQIFAVNVTDEVVIDSTNLEAYNPNTSALENRKVTGNIANLKLNTGTSTLKFSGNLTKATITDYVRYL